MRSAFSLFSSSSGKEEVETVRADKELLRRSVPPPSAQIKASNAAWEGAAKKLRP